jgi:hypothetical protein
MTHVNTHAGRLRRLRALAFLVVLVGACNEADNLTGTNSPEIALDSVTNDSTAVDSAAVDSLALIDSLANDSLAIDAASQLTPSALLAESAMYARSGIPFGPDGLWSGYTQLKSSPVRFSGSTNYTDARGIVKQINAARAMRHRLILNMTGGSHARHKTRGKFDYAKWKATMNTYNKREIKAAVAQGVADGTIILNSVMDEPNVPDWGGVMTKPLLDKMARYVKAMFPTLPVGVSLRMDWREHERFRVMDAYITAYSHWKGAPSQFRQKVLAGARAQGMQVVFGMNVLDGGIVNWKTKACPQPATGGRGTYAPACRMSARQVRDWGTLLGPAGCGMILWRYDRAFLSKSANVKALRDVASKLSNTPGRSCRRS